MTAVAAKVALLVQDGLKSARSTNPVPCWDIQISSPQAAIHVCPLGRFAARPCMRLVAMGLDFSPAVGLAERCGAPASAGEPGAWDPAWEAPVRASPHCLKR